MSRLSGVKSCLLPDYRAFIRVSRPFNFEPTTPLPFGLDISVWDLRMGEAFSSRIEVYMPTLAQICFNPILKSEIENLISFCKCRKFFFKEVIYVSVGSNRNE